jgi:hypothetical protein
MRQADEVASARIEAILTAEQKKEVPGALAEVDAFRAAGIPLEVYASLKLTADQEKGISAIGSALRPQTKPRDAAADQRPDPRAIRQATREKIRGVLTDKQRLTLAEYQADHQGPGFGPGGDNQGPPPPGGPGGDNQGPPPSGGPGGDDQGPPPPGGPGGDDQGPPPPGGPGGDDQGPPPPDQN